jgi:hypothetical protein
MDLDRGPIGWRLQTPFHGWRSEDTWDSLEHVTQAATHHLVVVEHEHGAATATQSSASFITPSAKADVRAHL